MWTLTNVLLLVWLVHLVPVDLLAELQKKNIAIAGIKSKHGKLEGPAAGFLEKNIVHQLPWQAVAVQFPNFQTKNAAMGLIVNLVHQR